MYRSPSRSARGGQRSEVAARTRLREELAPDLVGIEGCAQVPLLLVGCAVALDRTTGQHQSDHVQHRRDAGAGALEQPGPVVVDAQPAPAELGRPVDARIAGVANVALPGDALVDQIGRADRAVVARCGPGVLGEPTPRLRAGTRQRRVRRAWCQCRRHHARPTHRGISPRSSWSRRRPSSRRPCRRRPSRCRRPWSSSFISSPSSISSISPSSMSMSPIASSPIARTSAVNAMVVPLSNDSVTSTVSG